MTGKDKTINNKTMNIFAPKAFTASGSTVVGTGNVFVHSIIIPKASANTITLEDASGTDYFVFPSATVAGCYIFDAVFPSGLTVTTAGADVGVVNYGQ